MRLTLLHTNDFHGALDAKMASRLRELKGEHSALFFDSGDCVKTGNLGIPFKAEAVWPLLAQAGCDASVPGNRESHVLESAFMRKLEGAQHPILCANLRKKDGSRPLPATLILERDGFKIGVFGVMVPMVTDRMKTQAASAYLWDAPIPTAVAITKDLRPKVDLLIALTHIGYREDVKLAQAAPEVDIILGGHSHTVLEKPEIIGKTAICQGGSHGRYVGVYGWEPEVGLVAGELLPLKGV